MIAEQAFNSPNRHCVWMSAGLLTYKLCDRDFDCEHCPLDAALRGEPFMGKPPLALSKPGLLLRVFPDDRRYSTGHLWVQPLESLANGSARLGLDAFAAALIAQASEVRWKISGERLRPGQSVCEIDLDLGVLSLGTPVQGSVRRGNEILEQDPRRLITSPYREGWIVELSGIDSSHMLGLLSAEEARDQTRLDLRLFRRQLALYLLADTSSVGPSLADGGELLTDLRQLLGGRRYLELLRQLIR